MKEKLLNAPFLFCAGPVLMISGAILLAWSMPPFPQTGRVLDDLFQLKTFLAGDALFFLGTFLTIYYGKVVWKDKVETGILLYISGMGTIFFAPVIIPLAYIMTFFSWHPAETVIMELLLLIPI